MLTARDELSNLVETLTEAEAAAVLVHLRATMPQLYAGDEDYEDAPTRCHYCRTGIGSACDCT